MLNIPVLFFGGAGLISQVVVLVFGIHALAHIIPIEKITKLSARPKTISIYERTENYL